MELRSRTSPETDFVPLLAHVSYTEDLLESNCDGEVKAKTFGISSFCWCMVHCCTHNRELWGERWPCRRAVTIGYCPLLCWNQRFRFAVEGCLCLFESGSQCHLIGSELGQRRSPHSFLLPTEHITLSRLWIRPCLTASYDTELELIWTYYLA